MVFCFESKILILLFSTSKIFHQIQNLSTKQNPRVSSNFDEAEDDDRECRPVSLPEGLKVYLKQSVSWAGIGLSLL
jgi:hypothetical protein